MAYSKVAFAALDPETRAFTLVGAYMGYFALLEQGINAAISEVLEVDGQRATIVTRNMTFSDKIFTLRTLVNSFVTDNNVAKRFDKLAVAAQDVSTTRNIIAHTPFRASHKSDGVEFFVVKAKNQLMFPEMDWSIDQFIGEIDTINRIDNQLRSMESHMALQKVIKALVG